MTDLTERRFLTPRQVEEIYQVSTGTLANWRLYSRGPAYIKFGRLIRYDAKVIEKFFSNYVVLTFDQSDGISLIDNY